MLRTIIISLAVSFLVISCSNPEITMETEMNSDLDYRAQWVGTYEGTKSNRSFDDTMFITEVSFEVTIDSESDDGLIVNGTSFPVDEEGNYGPDFLDEGQIIYTLRIDEDGELKLESNVVNVLGLALPCFIIANKV